MVEIKLADGAEELGLALMLEGLVSQNLEANPGKESDFNKLNIGIGLIVPDAEIRLTMEFAKGALTIYPGVTDKAKLVITSDADTIMSLSNQKIKWGLPYYFDETGKEILAAMRTGRLKVRGLLHFMSLVRFSRVMSVH